jgi:hypothetical protein
MIVLNYKLSFFNLQTMDELDKFYYRMEESYKLFHLMYLEEICFSYLFEIGSNLGW